MKTKINGFEIEGSIEEILSLIRSEQPTKTSNKRKRYRTGFSRRAWTADDDMSLIKMREEGYSSRLIARELGRTEASVNARAAKLKATKKWN